jgi:Tol biopolymer transport system component
LAVLVAVPISAAANETEPYERPGRTELVSAGPEGECPTWYTQQVGISGDGRYAGFSVRGQGLAPGDDHETTKVYIRDLHTGEVQVGSVNSAGETQRPTRFAYDPILSYDGRYLAFASNDENLVEDKTTARYDIFLRDRVAGSTERVSLPNDGGEMNADAEVTGVSDDGRFVLFITPATNLTDESGEARGWQAYLRDREQGETLLVSRREHGEPGYQVFQPVLSGDGSTVVYLLRDEDYLGRDPEDHHDFGPPFPPTYVFVYDVETGEVELASPNARGERPNSFAEWPTVSRDGRYVTFMSDATDLVPRDTNRQWDGFVYDRETGRTDRISVSDLGGELEILREHIHPAISPNGRWTAFLSADERVGGNHQWTTREVVLHDRWTRTTTLASVRRDNGERSAMYNQPPRVADDGTVVWMAAGRLHPEDCGLAPAYVRRRGPDTGVAWLQAEASGDEIEIEGATLFGSVRLAAAESSPAVEESPHLLRAAEVHYRHERADLLVRLMPERLPVISPVVPAPVWWVQRTAGVTTPLLYGLELSVDGVRHEVRVIGAGRNPGEPLDPHIELHRCEESCEVVSALDGSYGTAGHEVVVSLPLIMLQAGPEASLTGLRAFVGPAAAGIDGHGSELELGDATIPNVSAALALGTAHAEPPSGAFIYPASLDQGRLAGRVPIDAFEQGHVIWARACLGDRCGADAVALARVGTTLTVSDEVRGGRRTLLARLSRADDPQRGIEGRRIGFHAADGTWLGDEITDDEGLASLEVPPRYRAPHHRFEVRFDGDVIYLPSSVST